jgi:hypothetical protein
MISKVEIINNPYVHKVKILINGNAPSAFSPLDKFMNEPFLYWCERIFPELEKELNGGKFTLYFESRKEEIRILEKISRKYNGCTQFSSREILRNTPLIERMASLSRLLKDHRISSYHHTVKRALFIIPDEERMLQSEIAGLNIENRYCKIESEAISISDYLGKMPSADIPFLVCRSDTAQKYLEKNVITGGYMILLSDHSGFEQIYKGIPVFYSTRDDFFDVVFECFVLGPLADIFYECITSLPEDIQTRFKEEIEILESTSLRIIIKPESDTVEMGTSIPIKMESDMPGYKIDEKELEYTYSEKGVIRCNGMRVEGLKPGNSILYVYRKGEKDPCARVPFKVIERNRVTELTIEDQAIMLGEGDRMMLNWNFNPPNADNLSKITWSSDDSSVVKVDQKGQIQAVNAGDAFVRILCEQVSAKTLVHVLPHIRDIEISQNEMELCPGDSIDIPAKTIPSVTIEGGLKMAVMDVRVANAVNGKLTAFAIGDTVLVVQDKKEQIRKEISIHVISEKKRNKKKKKGLLSVFFG